MLNQLPCPLRGPVTSLLLVIVLILSACGGAAPVAEPAPPAADEAAAESADTTDTETAAEAPAAGDGAYNEAPMLAERVKAGELPPVDERLPAEPYVAGQDMLVVGLPIQTGQYGGVMRLAQESPSGDPHIYIGMNEPLIWAPGGFEYDRGFHGNVARDFEVNEDDTVFTIHLRQGLRWSDGEPVTTEDVRFAFEDVLYNEEITPVFPTWLRSGNRGDGTPVQVEIVDDYTFRLIFDEPYGSFPAQLAIAGWHSYAPFLKPKHYMSQFHINYTPLEELLPLMEEESIPEDQWYNLFNDRSVGNDLWKHTTEGGLGHPTLQPWMLTQVQSGVFTYERNPYYFKVDSAGNQLPYIDGIRSEVVQDKETLTARALMGEFDYLGERASLKKLPLMMESQDTGAIKVLIPRMHRLPINFSLNLTYSDPVWREVTGDVRFRKALSMAINRPEIRRTFYLDQFASLPDETDVSPYDPEAANALLDEMGLDQRDSEGFRLGPDGERFTILFEIGDMSEDHVPMGELIAEYWKAVGIDTTVRAGDWNLINQRWQANETQGMSLWAHEDIWPSAGWDDYLPGNFWGREWAQWFTSNGELGEEPPQAVKDLYDSHSAFITARIGTPESQAALDAIYQNLRDNIWTFNVVEESYYPTFFSSKIQNVPTGMSDTLGIVIMYSMEQWYFAE